MPKIPRLSTKQKPSMPQQKVDTSLRDAKGNVRPEQAMAMEQLMNLGKAQIKPFTDEAIKFLGGEKAAETILNTIMSTASMVGSGGGDKPPAEPQRRFKSPYEMVDSSKQQKLQQLRDAGLDY